MKKTLKRILALTLLTLSIPVASRADTGTIDAGTIDAGKEAAFARLLDRAVQRVAAEHDAGTLKTFDLERSVISGDVAHYELRLRVGAGEHDEIALHRVVRERAPWVPKRRERAVFLVHGAAWGFEASFLTSLGTPQVPDDQSLAVFLAENDVDVWGVDFRWTLVPADETDLSFMADWGFGTDVGDLDVALALARSIRLLTGSGASKVTLAGWSRGGQIGYAQLSAETERPGFLRHVRAFIPVDIHFKTDDETVRQAACATYASVQAQIDDGFFASGFTVVAEIGDLASSAPEDPSPFFPSLSNADLAEWIGADPTPGSAFPALHSVGGIVDPDTFVTELLYTQPAHWFAYLSAVSPYQPLKIDLEGSALVCDELDSPYDDHLAEITVPVLFVGAAGGYGEVGFYTLSLLGSSDVTTLLVAVSAQPVEDYGHNDLFLADGAEALVWQPILDWVLTH